MYKNEDLDWLPDTESRPGTYDPAPQLSAAWFSNRIGLLTASKLNNMLDFKKDGTSGAKRLALIEEIVGERLTDKVADHYVTPAMQWGRANEDGAAQRYEEITGRTAKRCGFFAHPTIEYLGASPDRIVGKNGLLETKCPTTATHINWLEMTECPDDYKPQMILQLECTGRQWCDFATFDPRVPERLQMAIWRYEPTDEERHYIIEECKRFLALVDERFEQIIDMESRIADMNRSWK